MRRFLTVLALLSLTLRSLLPVGFMLAPSAADEMTVVICTGHGPLTVTLDADGKPVPTKPKLTDAGLCAYASPGATTLADAAPAPAARDVLYARRARPSPRGDGGGATPTRRHVAARASHRTDLKTFAA